LRTWGGDGEWKATRLLRLLANGAFVIAEASEELTFEETELEGGVFWAMGAEGIEEAVRRYLEDGEGRRRVGERGRVIVMEKRGELILERVEI